MKDLGERAKNAIRAAVLGGSVVAGAAASESATEINKAKAQTIRQESRGSNSPNIIGSGNVIIRGTGEAGKPEQPSPARRGVHPRWRLSG